jgi:3'-phosphoadenosine 5'-phosphosulfate sulfotransferase (PAPS reductase)/FAD synthetase
LFILASDVGCGGGSYTDLNYPIIGLTKLQRLNRYQPKDYQMDLKVTLDGEEHLTTASQFFAANDFDPEFEQEIRAALEAGRRFEGGGGASPPWSVELVEIPDCAPFEDDAVWSHGRQDNPSDKKGKKIYQVKSTGGWRPATKAEWQRRRDQGLKKEARHCVADFRRITVKSFKKYDALLINISGGKDSQVMLDVLVKQAVKQGYPLEQIVVVHADLGRVDWPGTQALCAKQVASYGLRFEVQRHETEDILDTAERRGAWPGPDKGRWCTSDHKRGPINRLITQLHQEWVAGGGRLVASRTEMEDLGLPQPAEPHKLHNAARRLLQWWLIAIQTTDVDKLAAKDMLKGMKYAVRQAAKLRKGAPVGGRVHQRWDKKLVTLSAFISDLERDAGVVIGRKRTARPRRKFRLLNCIGNRGNESAGRMAEPQLHDEDRQVTLEKHVDRYFPIKWWSEDEVWERIRPGLGRPKPGTKHRIRKGDLNYHPAYDLGMPRLSCVFCFYANEAGLLLAGYHNPKILKLFVKYEKRIRRISDKPTGQQFKKETALADIQKQIKRGWKPRTTVQDWRD